MTRHPASPHESSYAGVAATFCRVPLARDAAGLAGADVAIIGAPFDEGVSYRPGTRFGPRAIRLAEDMGAPPMRPHMELGVDPFAVLQVVDYDDVDAIAANLAASQANLRQAVGEALAAKAVPVVLGGDHSLSYPVMEALAATYGRDGYTLLHFDTHADTGADVHGVVNSHGTPFYRAVEDGLLAGANIVQIGLRGAWPFPEEFQWMRERGFRWYTMDEVDDRGIGAVTDEAIAYAASRAPVTYLSVDIDVLDPAYAPGTGTPEPGGLTTRELLRAVRRIGAGLDLCAADLVEVSPPYDPAGITALAGQRVVLELLSGMASRRSGQPPRPERPAPLA